MWAHPQAGMGDAVGDLSVLYMPALIAEKTKEPPITFFTISISVSCLLISHTKFCISCSQIEAILLFIVSEAIHNKIKDLAYQLLADLRGFKPYTGYYPRKSYLVKYLK